MTAPTTLPLTINDETRMVEVYDIFGTGRRLDSVQRVALYQKRSGGKLWAENVIFWLQRDGSYRANLLTTILNRSGYHAVAWNDAHYGNRSEHNSASSATGVAL